MRGTSRWDAIAVLPTGTSMNPANPAGATYFSPDLTAYVLFKKNEARTRPTRVVTSYGSLDGWRIGTLVHLEHDQTQAYLGEYQVVGIHHFLSGEWAGAIPDIKIKHCVVK